MAERWGCGERRLLAAQGNPPRMTFIFPCSGQQSIRSKSDPLSVVTRSLGVKYPPPHSDLFNEILRDPTSSPHDRYALRKRSQYHHMKDADHVQ